MDMIWLAISVTVLVGEDPDYLPLVNATPQRHYETSEACEEWRRDRYANTPGAIDPASDRPVMDYYYVCTPQDRSAG